MYALEDANVWRDDIDSVMVPYGYTLELYDGAYWDGYMERIDGPSYTDGNQRMKCITLNSWNWAASAIVYRNQAVGYARGYWKAITATETIQFVT